MNTSQPAIFHRPPNTPGSRGAARPRLFVASNFLSTTPGSRTVQEDLVLRLEERGYTTVKTSHIRNGVLRGTDMFHSALRNRRHYDLALVDVYSHRAFRWAEMLSFAMERLRKPLVLALHGGGLPDFAVKNPDRVRRCLARAATVVAPSRYLAVQMAPYRGGIQLLPNGLELGRYPYRRRSQTAPRIAWIRAFHQVYNPSLAPRVLAVLRETYPEARLVMVGPDKGDGSLSHVRKTVAALGLQDAVELVGGVSKDEVPRWLEGSDVFLNTTNVDNTPVSVLEAMACGLCVVSTNVGGLPYLLEDGRTALLVEPENAEAAAAAIGCLLQDACLVERISTHARAQAEEMDWSRIVPRWEALLEQVALGGE